MEIILKKDVENLGFTDDVVTVKNGYGRNFLIPQGKAILATISAKKALSEKLKQSANKDKSAIEEANKILKKLEKLELTISAKVIESDKLFGSVTSQMIIDALADLGYTVDKKEIIIDESIKTLGNHFIHINLDYELKAKVKVKVSSKK